MAVKFAGFLLRNPLGLAAGFDKNAQASHGAIRLGFGFAEVGTITPWLASWQCQTACFRLPEDEAVINRYGFNSKGMKLPETICVKLGHRQGQLIRR